MYGIFEVGMNHFGEIRTLVGFVRPHVALITTIAPAHLEFFGNEEAIADAKSEIFEGLAPGGVGLVPSDSPHSGRLLARAKQSRVGRILTFGAGPGSDAKLISIDEEAAGQKIRADILGRPVEAFISAPGAHIASNAVGALTAVAALDGDVFNAAAALRNFTALKGRGARIAAGGVSIIDESYNANPASMEAALAMLAQARGRRIAVLGDMLELGTGAGELHRALARPIEAARVDMVFASGPHMKSLWEALPAGRRGAYAESSVQLAPLVAAAVSTGDTVLVKGSNGSRMSVVIDALRARGA
jgi:UDP-N-acetylmuramoyl-tripeptide--D-alanyl-D-alanine ligase